MAGSATSRRLFRATFTNFALHVRSALLCMCTKNWFGCVYRAPCGSLTVPESVRSRCVSPQPGPGFSPKQFGALGWVAGQCAAVVLLCWWEVSPDQQCVQCQHLPASVGACYGSDRCGASVFLASHVTCTSEWFSTEQELCSAGCAAPLVGLRRPCKSEPRCSCSLNSLLQLLSGVAQGTARASQPH